MQNKFWQKKHKADNPCRTAFTQSRTASLKKGTLHNLKQIAAPKRLAHAKGPSEKTQLIKLLIRKSGTDAKAISPKFRWQPHTTRAALSGLRKAGFDVAKENTGSGKPTWYRIVSAPKAAVAAEATDGK